MPCSLDRCPNQSRWRPNLELRAKQGVSPSTAEFCNLGVCNEHKSVITLQHVLSDEGFTKLSKFMAEAGKPRPDKQYTTLAWTPISPEDAEEMAEHQDQILSMPPDLDVAF